MIVRDAGDAWQVVLQTDHADLSGQFARAWGERRPRADSLVVAAERHDDGWAVWEQAPMVDSESGKPLNFLDVQVLAHLAFYRACIAAVTEEDPYAGLLVSMHGAGIYRQRYGRQTSLKITHADEVKPQVDAFVEEQERDFTRRIVEVGVGDEERWADYALLQIFDRLSLHFCLREAGVEPDEVDGYRLEPLAPWRLGIEPFPFVERPARFSLLLRRLPKRSRSDGEFRREFFAAPPERAEITFEGG